MEQPKGFLTPLRVENIDALNWRILERFAWRGTQGDVFEVDPGDITDFASVPWWTQSILPRTGTWTKAAVLHDKMCDEQNEYYRLKKLYESDVVGTILEKTYRPPVKPIFNSIDTDAIFRKNAREGGTDVVRSELLWMGVRLGALRNPARRGGWFSTAPRVIADLVLVLAFLYLCIFAILWIAHSL